jgi:hypothetical protein
MFDKEMQDGEIDLHIKDYLLVTEDKIAIRGAWCLLARGTLPYPQGLEKSRRPSSSGKGEQGKGGKA